MEKYEVKQNELEVRVVREKMKEKQKVDEEMDEEEIEEKISKGEVDENAKEGEK